jgi:hypothetical protein
MKHGMKFLCLLLLAGLASGCVDVEAQRQQAAASFEHLREQTDQDRGDCGKAKTSDADACLRYDEDIQVSNLCRAYYGQFPGIDTTCEAQKEYIVSRVIECKNGNQPSCVEIRVALDQIQQQRQAQQDALQQSAVQAQWAQAQAQAAQARAQAAAAQEQAYQLQQQTRQLQQQTRQLQQPVTTNCRPDYFGGVHCTQY